jgi:UDPglucose 6-dehydrogenase
LGGGTKKSCSPSSKSSKAALSVCSASPLSPHTDDLREAPAIVVARQFIARGANVRAHDPVALARARQEYADCGIVFCESAAEVADTADALVLVTEWPEYRDLAWEDLVGGMRTRLILDGRHFLDRSRLTRAGAHYAGIMG